MSQQNSTLKISKKEFVDKLYKILKIIRDVNKFTKETGVVASVYQKVQNDYVRISTTLCDTHNVYALNTKLDRSTRAYKRISKNKAYVGKMTLFKKKYFVKYSPFVTDNQHGTLIVLAIAIPLLDQPKK